MTQTQKPTTYKLAPNVPVSLHLKYIDVWPNNPANNYGANICFTGELNNKPVRIYRTMHGEVINALTNAGIIDADEMYEMDPAEKYSIPVLVRDITIGLVQPAGQKWPTFKVKAGTHAPQHADLPMEQTATPSQKAPPAAGKAPQGHERMQQAFGHALEIITAAQAICNERGLDVAFTGEDIRSTAISLFIEGR